MRFNPCKYVVLYPWTLWSDLVLMGHATVKPIPFWKLSHRDLVCSDQWPRPKGKGADCLTIQCFKKLFKILAQYRPKEYSQLIQPSTFFFGSNTNYILRQRDGGPKPIFRTQRENSSEMRMNVYRPISLTISCPISKVVDRIINISINKKKS